MVHPFHFRTVALAAAVAFVSGMVGAVLPFVDVVAGVGMALTAVAYLRRPRWMRIGPVGVPMGVIDCAWCPMERTMALWIKYPQAKLDASIVDGNAFSIMGAAKWALRQAGIPKTEIDCFLNECRSGDYDHLLETVFAWITVTGFDPVRA